MEETGKAHHHVGGGTENASQCASAIRRIDMFSTNMSVAQEQHASGAGVCATVVVIVLGGIFVAHRILEETTVLPPAVTLMTTNDWRTSYDLPRTSVAFESWSGVSAGVVGFNVSFQECTWGQTRKIPNCKPLLAEVCSLDRMSASHSNWCPVGGRIQGSFEDPTFVYIVASVTFTNNSLASCRGHIVCKSSTSVIDTEATWELSRRYTGANNMEGCQQPAKNGAGSNVCLKEKLSSLRLHTSESSSQSVDVFFMPERMNMVRLIQRLDDPCCRSAPS
jgi:hypothetical protein